MILHADNPLNIKSLFDPEQKDLSFLTPELLKFFHALSVTAYDLDTENWQRQGWTDITLHLEKDIKIGKTLPINSTTDRYREWKTLIADKIIRNASAKPGLISQVYNLHLQREDTHLCRCTVFAKKIEGRYVIALGFMGTKSRISDWLINFKMTPVDNFHKGFYALAKSFLQDANTIEFPALAQAVQRPHLTLFDILEEAKKENSPFFICAAGHSQGSAVMQCFLYELYQSGVLRSNMLGVGFASPTVRFWPVHETDLPIFHFLNSDDLICRVGAKYHIGCSYIYPMNDLMRASAYGSIWKKRKKPHRQDAMRILSSLSDTRKCLCFLTACINSFCQSENSIVLEFLNGLFGKKFDFPLAGFIQNYSFSALEALKRKIIRQAMLLDGCPMTQDEINGFSSFIAQIAQNPAEMGSALNEILSAAHRISSPVPADGFSIYESLCEEKNFSKLRPLKSMPANWTVLFHSSSH